MRSGFVSEGNLLISLEEEDLGAVEHFSPSFRGKGGYITPKVGEIYDFTKCQRDVWVGGKPYPTVAHGDSRCYNVTGKKIEIVKTTAGTPSIFAKIHFKFV